MYSEEAVSLANKMTGNFPWNRMKPYNLQYMNVLHENTFFMELNIFFLFAKRFTLVFMYLTSALHFPAIYFN